MSRSDGTPPQLRAPRLRLLAALVALSILATACGGDDDTSTTLPVGVPSISVLDTGWRCTDFSEDLVCNDWHGATQLRPEEAPDPRPVLDPNRFDDFTDADFQALLRDRASGDFIIVDDPDFQRQLIDRAARLGYDGDGVRNYFRNPSQFVVPTRCRVKVVRFFPIAICT